MASRPDRAAVTAPPSRTTSPAHGNGSRAPRLAIRAATLDDLETVLALRLALVREEATNPVHGPLRPDAEERARLQYAAQLQEPRETTFLAFDRTRAVGILRCTVSQDASLARPTRYAFLTSAYVLPPYRRRGVLRALLARADEWSRERGLREMRLHTYFDNVEGNSAWEALGFDPIELRRRRVIPRR